MKTKQIGGCLLAVLLICGLFAACSGKGSSAGSPSGDSYAKYTDLQADDNGIITIPAEGITETARFFNYDVNGVTVQLVALRDRKDSIHVAFNTCQNCSPSPKAYYQQAGDVLQCTNCGFTFEPEEVGITHGGCNPWPIEGLTISESEITIPLSSIEGMQSAFASWEGPTK